MAKASKKQQYPSAPSLGDMGADLKHDISVGNMNRAFQVLPGPQRNRPEDSARWKSSLVARARAYAQVGEFSIQYSYKGYNPLLVRQRIASYRGDGQYYPLDGNGSNHWYEALFGPDFLPPTGTLVIDVRKADGTPDFAVENKVMQAVQVAKNMTQFEKFTNNRQFDATSKAYQIYGAAETEGFSISQRTTDARSLGVTVADKIRLLDPALLGPVLAFVKEAWPSVADRLQRYPCFADDFLGPDGKRDKTAAEAYRAAVTHNYERTNGSLVIATAIMFNRSSTDKKRLLRALQSRTINEFADGARGKGAENIVLPRIEEAYEALAD
jgi:hypothetical protein